MFFFFGLIQELNLLRDVSNSYIQRQRKQLRSSYSSRTKKLVKELFILLIVRMRLTQGISSDDFITVFLCLTLKRHNPLIGILRAAYLNVIPPFEKIEESHVFTRFILLNFSNFVILSFFKKIQLNHPFKSPKRML